MCKAWDDHAASEEARGEARSLLTIVANMQKNMRCSLDEVLLAIGKNREEYEKAKQLLEH